MEVSAKDASNLAGALDRLEFYAGLMPVLTGCHDAYWNTAEGRITKDVVLKARGSLKELGVHFIEQINFPK